MTLWIGHDVAVTLGWQDCIVKCQTGLVRDQGLDIVMTFVNCLSGALLQIMIPSREFRNVRGCLNNFKQSCVYCDYSSKTRPLITPFQIQCRSG